MVKSRWADEPFKLIETPGLKGDLSDKTVQVTTEMALAHNSFFRGLNAIYLQAPFIRLPNDVSDFLVYCQCWFEMVSHHHDKEEEMFFPAIAKYSNDKGIMDANIEGHKAFHEGLEKFGTYAHTTKFDNYDGLELRKLIDGFASPFESHMRDEINSLLALDKDNGEKLLKAFKEFENAIVATADKYRQFPYVMGSRDNTFENGMHTWPPVPFFVPYIVHYYFERKHKGAWRFGPSTSFGIPRKLAFLPETSE